jgi:peptidoglycan/xylan/chitin deacetylase (PgdA/CDA1 family)
MDKVIITTSWDDGHPLDLKLAELLKKYDIPATFYISIDSSAGQSMNPQQIREIAQSFDVGSHTYHHVNLTRVSLEEAQKEILEGREALEDILGKGVLSFCYPYGSFNDKVASIVKQAGFISARTMRFFSRRIRDPFKMGTTVNAFDLSFAPYIKNCTALQDLCLFWFILKSNLFFQDWDRVAIETLDFAIENGGVWHLWGHSWEINRNNDWQRLEQVCRRISALSKEAYKADNSQLIKMWRESG